MIQPADPLIYHITHLANLPGILHEGGLWCDKQRIAQNIASTNIGHKHIKDRRLCTPVKTASGGFLGDYVPFNFCYRSVMLCAVQNGHQDYMGGQETILHLVSSVKTAVNLGKPWVFTDRHAELAHALHFDNLDQLCEVPWAVMDEHYWVEVKEERQAEFLVHDFFPWSAVVEVAAMTQNVAQEVTNLIQKQDHQPVIKTCRAWYY